MTRDVTIRVDVADGMPDDAVAYAIQAMIRRAQRVSPDRRIDWSSARIHVAQAEVGS